MKVKLNDKVFKVTSEIHTDSEIKTFFSIIDLTIRTYGLLTDGLTIKDINNILPYGIEIQEIEVDYTFGEV